MHAFNMLDVIIAVTVLGGLALGYHRGFFAQLISFAGFFAAFLTAFVFYDDVSPLAARLIPLHTFQSYRQYAFLIEGLNLDVYFYNAVSFTVLFVLTKIGLSVLGGVLNVASKVPGVNAVNKYSGALLGFLEAGLLVVIAVHLMSILPSDPLQAVLRESEAAHWIMEQMPDVAAKLQQLWNERPV